MTTDQQPEAQPTLHDKVIEAISTVYDPEIPVNIYEMGLIYKVSILEDKKVHVLMTLTTPGCFAAQMLPNDVKEAVERLDEVDEAEVEITFEPAWDMTMLSDAARLELGMM